MKLKSREDLDKVLADGGGNVAKDRKAELLTHATCAVGQGKLQELFDIFNAKPEDGGLKANEKAFFNKLVDATAPDPAAEAAGLVAPAPATNGASAK